MNFVADVEQITKRWSVKLAKLGAALSMAYAALAAAGLTGSIPPWVAQAIAGVIFVGVALAAYLKQGNLPDTTVAQDSTTTTISTTVVSK